MYYILSKSFVSPAEKEVRKDYEQERDRSRLVRVSDSVRHAAMRRPKAWRGGSKAQQSCVPATALGVESDKEEHE